jgi:uncharacterized protein (TIGR02118 family)
MINAVTLLRRKHGLSVDEFQDYWRNNHAGVIARLPGVRRYVQSHPLREIYQRKEPVYDGVAELCANDSQAFRDIAASDAYVAVQADEEKFLDRAAISLVLTDEHVIKDGPVAADGVKCVRLFNRRHDIPVEEFQSHWREVYGPQIAMLPSLDRYAQYHARLGGYAHGRQPDYDGFDITWFESIDAQRNAMHSTVWDRGRSEQKKFLVSENCQQILAREFVIID